MNIYIYIIPPTTNQISSTSTYNYNNFKRFTKQYFHCPKKKGFNFCQHCCLIQEVIIYMRKQINKYGMVWSTLITGNKLQYISDSMDLLFQRSPVGYIFLQVSTPTSWRGRPCPSHYTALGGRSGHECCLATFSLCWWEGAYKSGFIIATDLVK